MLVSNLGCQRTLLYVAVFILIAAFVSPGFSIIHRRSVGYTEFRSVWYSLLCVNGHCETWGRTFDHGVSVAIMWPIIATSAVLMGIVAVLVDVRQQVSTRASQGQRRLELVQFITLLLTSFQALMVSLAYGNYSIGSMQAQEGVQFPPSTVAFGVAGILLLIQVVERYIVQRNMTPPNEHTELESTYRQFE